jgi:hypothetical protein
VPEFIQSEFSLSEFILSNAEGKGRAGMTATIKRNNNKNKKNMELLQIGTV